MRVIIILVLAVGLLTFSGCKNEKDEKGEGCKLNELKKGGMQITRYEERTQKARCERCRGRGYVTTVKATISVFEGRIGYVNIGPVGKPFDTKHEEKEEICGSCYGSGMETFTVSVPIWEYQQPN